MALRKGHLCHWCSSGGNWCLNRVFQRQRAELWCEKCFMIPFWRNRDLSRLPLQESHKCVRLQKKVQEGCQSAGFVLFILLRGVVTLLSVAGLVAQTWVFELRSPVFLAEVHHSSKWHWHWDISTPHPNEPISYVLEAWEQTAVA